MNALSDTRLAVLCGTCLNQDSEVNFVKASLTLIGVFLICDFVWRTELAGWAKCKSDCATRTLATGIVCDMQSFGMKYQMLKWLKRVPVLIFKTLKPVAATVTNCRNALGIPCEKLPSSLWISKSRRLERGRNLAG